MPLHSTAQGALLHFRPDHAYLAMKPQDLKNNLVAFEGLRRSPLGNSVRCRVIAYLAGESPFQRGFQSSLPTVSDPAIPADVASRLAIPSSCNRISPPAAAMYRGLQSHQANKVRQVTSGHSHKRGLRRSTNSRLGRWRTLILSKRKTQDKHIILKSSGRPAPARMEVSQSAARDQRLAPRGQQHPTAGGIRQKETFQSPAEIQKWACSSLYPGRLPIAADGIHSLSPQPGQSLQPEDSSAPESERREIVIAPKDHVAVNHPSETESAASRASVNLLSGETVSSSSPQALQPREQHILCLG